MGLEGRAAAAAALEEVAGLVLAPAAGWAASNSQVRLRSVRAAIG